MTFDYALLTELFAGKPKGVGDSGLAIVASLDRSAISKIFPAVIRSALDAGRSRPLQRRRYLPSA